MYSLSCQSLVYCLFALLCECVCLRSTHMNIQLRNAGVFASCPHSANEYLPAMPPVGSGCNKHSTSCGCYRHILCCTTKHYSVARSANVSAKGDDQTQGCAIRERWEQGYVRMYCMNTQVYTFTFLREHNLLCSYVHTYMNDVLFCGTAKSA